MLSLLTRVIGISFVLLVLTACSHTPRLVENTNIAYFDERGNNLVQPKTTGSYRRLIKIQADGYLVQNFFTDTNTKQTDPFLITVKEDITAIAPASINGPFVQWYRNGQKASAGNFVHGKRQGTFIEWTKRGVKWAEMNFDNDLSSGPAKLWYGNGSRHIEGQYLNGREQGVWNIWRKDGSLRLTATFHNGNIISAQDSKGQPIDITKADFAGR